MQQTQYEAVIREFAGRAEHEKAILPEQLHVYTQTVNALQRDDPTTDGERDARVDTIIDELSRVTTLSAMLAMLGDPQGNLVLDLTSGVLCMLQMARAVAAASVVQVSFEATGTEG